MHCLLSLVSDEVVCLGHDVGYLGGQASDIPEHLLLLLLCCVIFAILMLRKKGPYGQNSSFSIM